MRGPDINSAVAPGAHGVPPLGAASAGPAPPGIPSTREDLAALLFARRGVLRARIIRAARRAGVPVDVDDALSSAFRRLDLEMVRGTIRASSEREFWAYVAALTDNLTLDRLRHAGHEIEFLARESPGTAARFERCRDNDAAAALLHEVLMSLESEADRELAHGRLQGRTYRELAHEMGCGDAALRQRWSTICRKLREKFGSDEGTKGRRDEGTKGRRDERFYAMMRRSHRSATSRRPGVQRCSWGTRGACAWGG